MHDIHTSRLSILDVVSREQALFLLFFYNVIVVVWVSAIQSSAMIAIPIPESDCRTPTQVFNSETLTSSDSLRRLAHLSPSPGSLLR
ncbi:hypothetical protein [Planctomicrobium sp. SH527]|uniref:hypothetical protein n=1 Tax=Planctomicrobium sp. SH527 TaxID=3448123 RepID=UPI003F5B7DD5